MTDKTETIIKFGIFNRPQKTNSKQSSKVGTNSASLFSQQKSNQTTIWKLIAAIARRNTNEIDNVLNDPAISVDPLSKEHQQNLTSAFGGNCQNPLLLAMLLQNIDGTEATNQSGATSAGVVTHLASRYDQLQAFMSKAHLPTLNLKKIIQSAYQLEQSNLTADASNSIDAQQPLSALILGFNSQAKYQELAQEILESQEKTPDNNINYSR